jgi:Fe-S-cluster containining protein
MSVKRKQKSIYKLFKELDNQIAEFSNESGIKCKTGCGECCMFPKIHATVLEFIPFALKMVISGKASGLLETLQNKDAAISSCIIFSPISLNSSNGRCSDYENRGLICRLYGYSAHNNKDGSHSMITCSIIKANNPHIFNNEVSYLSGYTNLPIASEFYSRLQSIDLSLTLETYPINMAIKKALEYVLGYYSYRKHPE